jgi:hypothetical protein
MKRKESSLLLHKTSSRFSLFLLHNAIPSTHELCACLFVLALNSNQCIALAKRKKHTVNIGLTEVLTEQATRCKEQETFEEKRKIYSLWSPDTCQVNSAELKEQRKMRKIEQVERVKERERERGNEKKK